MTIFAETDPLPNFVATAVGSLPHTDATEAVDLILGALKAAPHAPQLPRTDPREQMWIQFTEGLPRFHVDVEKLSYYFDTSGDVVPDVEAFYVAYLQVAEGAAADAFVTSPAYGKGIHLFLERLKQDECKRPVIKVQVTGPLSFGLTVTDEHRKPIFYHPMFRDVIVKGVGLKAVAMVELFKPFAENVVVFFDEPALSAYGSSAWLGVSQSDVVDSLNEVFSLSLERGAIPGVHCCGNTDWGLLMQTEVRIINFDAVDYMDSFSIYAGAVNDFLRRGGIPAWGAVPNTERATTESAADIRGRIEAGIKQLCLAGVDRDLLTRRMIVTPACGCASLTVSQAKKVYSLLSELERQGPDCVYS
ncbi:MAG: hypothetical protein LDL33_12120 [Desulfomonile sp.]|nr:hypothetical protein [Desulfomonile sp.]